MKSVYAMQVKDDTADVYIYGEVSSEKWFGTEISAKDVVDQINGSHAANINVYIQSYGGEVAEGLAIYNALRRSKATVTTYCDGFACSIASVIFMAGKHRKMHKSSLLMIHNAWMLAVGNADELEKQAEDLRTINEAIKQAYLDAVSITKEELDKLLDAETWITPASAVEMGFATDVVDDEPAAKNKMSASARQQIFNAIIKGADISIDPEDPGDDPDDPEEPEPPEEPETDEEDLKKRVDALEERVTKLEEAAGDGEDDEEDPAEPDALQKLLKIFQ